MEYQWKKTSNLKTKAQPIVLKTIKGSSPNYALSIHTNYSTSQSRETVVLVSTIIITCIVNITYMTVTAMIIAKGITH